MDRLAGGNFNRISKDRRSNIPFFCLYHIGIKSGRRVGERRLKWNKLNYVDRYPGHLMLFIIAILTLSSLDAHLTLNILSRGGEELNWFMLATLNESVEKFVGVKMALTGLAVIMLVIHHNVQYLWKFRVRHMLYLTLTGYVGLIGYEIILLS